MARSSDLPKVTGGRDRRRGCTLGSPKSAQSGSGAPLPLRLTFFLATPPGLGDLSSPTRDRTRVPSSESTESSSPDRQGIPLTDILIVGSRRLKVLKNQRDEFPMCNVHHPESQHLDNHC